MQHCAWCIDRMQTSQRPELILKSAFAQIEAGAAAQREGAINSPLLPMGNLRLTRFPPPSPPPDDTPNPWKYEVSTDYRDKFP